MHSTDTLHYTEYCIYTDLALLTEYSAHAALRGWTPPLSPLSLSLFLHRLLFSPSLHSKTSLHWSSLLHCSPPLPSDVTFPPYRCWLFYLPPFLLITPLSPLSDNWLTDWLTDFRIVQKVRSSALCPCQSSLPPSILQILSAVISYRHRSADTQHHTGTSCQMRWYHIILGWSDPLTLSYPVPSCPILSYPILSVSTTTHPAFIDGKTDRDR